MGAQASCLLDSLSCDIYIVAFENKFSVTKGKHGEANILTVGINNLMEFAWKVIKASCFAIFLP